MFIGSLRLTREGKFGRNCQDAKGKALIYLKHCKFNNYTYQCNGYDYGAWRGICDKGKRNRKKKLDRERDRVREINGK